MPFSVGDTAIVRPLGKKIGEIIAVTRNGRYRVRVEGVTVSCLEEDLDTPGAPRRKQARAKGKQPASARPVEQASSPARIDLHGLAVEEALARLSREIDRALLRGADRLEVVHGKGQGRIRDAVQRYVSSLPVVATSRLDPQNVGVTWVFFR